MRRQLLLTLLIASTCWGSMKMDDIANLLYRTEIEEGGIDALNDALSEGDEVDTETLRRTIANLPEDILKYLHTYGFQKEAIPLLTYLITENKNQLIQESHINYITISFKDKNTQEQYAFYLEIQPDYTMFMVRTPDYFNQDYTDSSDLKNLTNLDAQKFLNNFQDGNLNFEGMVIVKNLPNGEIEASEFKRLYDDRFEATNLALHPRDVELLKNADKLVCGGYIQFNTNDEIGGYNLSFDLFENGIDVGHWYINVPLADETAAEMVDECLDGKFELWDQDNGLLD